MRMGNRNRAVHSRDRPRHAGIAVAGYAERSGEGWCGARRLPSTQAIHVASAARIAGKDLVSVARLCVPREGPAPAPCREHGRTGQDFRQPLFHRHPRRVVLGDHHVPRNHRHRLSSTNPREAQTFIEGGLRKLGLDPNQVKYVIITHAHTDHFGGAQYLADKFHAQLVMSETDWGTLSRMAPPTNPDRGPIPKRGTGVPDGFTLTLGDTSVEIIQTPPHTPGAISLIFPNPGWQSAPHGGALGRYRLQFPPDGSELHHLFQFRGEIRKDWVKARGVDVPIANHFQFRQRLREDHGAKDTAARGSHTPSCWALTRSSASLTSSKNAQWPDG